MTQRTVSENLKHFLRSKINFYGLKDIDKKSHSDRDQILFNWTKYRLWWERGGKGQQLGIFDIGITCKSDKV